MSEREELLQQLRDKYRRAAEKYGTKFFDLEQLEERIDHLKRSGGNLNSFFESEKEFFEKIETLAEKKHEAQKNREELNNRIDKIIEENEAKVAGYRDVYFDPRATHEIRHFVGAVTDFYDRNIPVVRNLFRGLPEWGDMQNSIANIERFYVPAESAPTMLLREYADRILNIGRGERAELERKTMQTGGQALYRLSLLMKKSASEMSTEIADMQVDLPQSEDPEVRDAFNGMSVRKAVDVISDEVDRILSDFRILDLVRHSSAGNN